MNVTVIGMGKIGLPLAVNFARHGARVLGLDINEEVVALINKGVEPFPGEFNLGSYLLDCSLASTLVASTDKEKSISNANVIVVCIPLVVDSDGNPDFENLDQLVIDIGRHMTRGTLISFETTLPVGTTRNRISVSLEATSNLKVGEGFYLVFSPERVLTGRIFEDLRRYPKLVGGVTTECTQRGVEFYRQLLDFEPRPDLSRPNGVWAMENAETAEFAKIAETTYRDVNIGLANEFAIYASAHNIDILDVIDASNSQPYSHIHSPGISVGGHCIPVYPRFYMWENNDAQIVTAARNRNLDMPNRAVRQIKEAMQDLKDLKIGILGITYRAGVKESAFSGAFDLLKLLESEGAKVYGLDPFYTEREIIDFGFCGVANLSELDGVLIHTDHKEFNSFEFDRFTNIKFLYDGRRTHIHNRTSTTLRYLTY